MNFTQRKFLHLEVVTQHLNAAKLLKEIYLNLLYDNYLNQTLLDQYHQIETWMKLPQLNPSFEEISHRFHFHLKNARQEDRYILPSAQLFDSPSSTPFLPIDIYLDHLRSLHNIGSIIRTIEAFRLGTLYFHDNLNLNHPKIKKTSMGTHNIVPIQPLSSFDLLKKPIIGIEITPCAKNIFHYTFPPSFSLLFGNEEYGLSKTCLELCDDILYIPLCGQKKSINVSCAFSIVAGLVSNSLRN